MFDVGALEFLLLLIVTLVVVGPQRLPEIARLIGTWTAKARSVIEQFRRDTELDQHLNALKDHADPGNGVIQDLDNFTSTVNRQVLEAQREFKRKLASESADPSPTIERDRISPVPKK